MKNIILTNILIVFCFISCSSDQTTSFQLELTNGKYYKISKKEPFTGETLDFYPGTNKQRVKTNYVDGMKDGGEIYWYENGQIMIEKYYKKGLEEGLLVMYYENGNKKLEITSKDGLPEGFVTTWYDSGQIMSKGYMNDGKKDKKMEFWYKSGKLKSIEFWKNKMKDSVWTSLDEAGEIIKKTYYMEGVEQNKPL